MRRAQRNARAVPRRARHRHRITVRAAHDGDADPDAPAGSRRGGPPCHSGSHGRTTTRTKSTTCSAGSPDHRRELQAAGEATCWPQALGSAERHAAEGYDMSIRAAGPLGAAAPLTTVGLPLSPSEAAEASRYPTWRDWGAAGGFSGGSSRCRRGGKFWMSLDTLPTDQQADSRPTDSVPRSDGRFHRGSSLRSARSTSHPRLGSAP